MRRQLTSDDYAMILQWIVVFVLAPFVLIPLLPLRQVTFASRSILIVGAILITAAMTLVYMWARRGSRRRAAIVANTMAVLDIVLVFTALILWPKAVADLFWILTVLVIVIAARFSYREAAVAALTFSAFYMITIGINYGADLTGPVLADALLRIVLMMLVAVSTVYVTQREKRERREARIISRIASAMGSTLDVDELMNTVVNGLSEAAGTGRCTALFISNDDRWAVPKSTTESDPILREKLFKGRINLKRDNWASRVIETREPLVITDADSEPIIDGGLTEDFGLSKKMALPLIMRDEVKGIIIVERRGIRKYFTDHEARIYQTIVAQAASGLENAMRYAEEQRKRSEADTLYRTSRELGSTLDVEQVLENACRLAIRSTGASCCAAFLVDEVKGKLAPRLVMGAGARRTAFPPEDDIDVHEFEDIYAMAQRPPALQLYKPVDYSSLPVFVRSMGRVLIAPFFMHGNIGGLLCAMDSEKREFDEPQVRQVAVVASEASLAVINARLHERLKIDAAQMASLVQLGNAIGSTSELSAVTRLALESLRGLFDCTSGLVYRINDKDGTMRCVEAFGYPDEIVERISSVPYPRAEHCWTVSEGRLIGVDDLSRTKLDCRTLEKIGHGSAMCVCMKAEDRTLGVLHVWSERPGAFREEDQQLALAFADQVGLAIQRALLFEEINRLAITDPLTGVFNVRRLESVLTDEINRGRRYKRPVSFLMVDVDNLKSYNDSLGHQQGDIVLSQVASIIDSTTREVDKVFRYGGDEFCVILPETDTDEATVVAEKVRRAVADFHFAGEEKISEESLTISVGVASFPKDSEEEGALILKADVALYAAKQKGRNTVSAAV